MGSPWTFLWVQDKNPAFSHPHDLYRNIYGLPFLIGLVFLLKDLGKKCCIEVILNDLFRKEARARILGNWTGIYVTGKKIPNHTTMLIGDTFQNIRQSEINESKIHPWVIIHHLGII